MNYNRVNSSVNSENAAPKSTFSN